MGSVKSSSSQRNKKSKSKGSRDIESLKSQVMSQKNLLENEISSSQKQMASINKNISENQIKQESDNKNIASGIKNISTSLVTIADNQSTFEKALASNAEALKEKKKNDKKKDERTIKYLGAVDERGVY